MEQDERYLQKHFMDLSRRAEERNIVTFSHFLNLNEQNIFHQITKELYSPFQLSGGYEHAERQMVAFIPDALSYVWEYPIALVRVLPSSPKFAETLTHRDVLGAIMNLGIKRETLGDILMQESGIIVICLSSISGYLMENCRVIRHTMVDCTEIQAAGFSYQPNLVEKDGIAASMRLDTIVADLGKMSRSVAQKQIAAGNVFVNARKILQSDYNCQDGDILSIRHLGKFQIETTGQVTKKGRIKYKYKVYA